MVTDKNDAVFEADVSLLKGHDVSVVERYREHVVASATRLATG
jgi:hypothetical protein